MKCPNCGSDNNHVVDSRTVSEDRRRRRYECHNCGGRFTTYECVENEHAERFEDLLKIEARYENLKYLIKVLIEEEEQRYEADRRRRENKRVRRTKSTTGQ